MFNKAYMCPLNPLVYTQKKTEMYTHNLSLCQINNYYFKTFLVSEKKFWPHFW